MRWRKGQIIDQEVNAALRVLPALLAAADTVRRAEAAREEVLVAARSYGLDLTGSWSSGDLLVVYRRVFDTLLGAPPAGVNPPRTLAEEGETFLAALNRKRGKK